MLESIWTHRLVKGGIGIVAILLAIALTLHFRNWVKIRRVREMQAAMANLPPEQRRENAQQFREAVGKLTAGQRRDLFADRRKQFEQRILAYRKMSPAEKKKFLDGAIDRMDNMRRQMGGGTGTFGAGPRANNLSSGDRDRMRRERLDMTTPEFRAAMDQFRHDMEQRRRERGGR
jgi:hypothetical protein